MESRRSSRVPTHRREVVAMARTTYSVHHKQDGGRFTLVRMYAIQRYAVDYARRYHREHGGRVVVRDSSWSTVWDSERHLRSGEVTDPRVITSALLRLARGERVQ